MTIRDCRFLVAFLLLAGCSPGPEIIVENDDHVTVPGIQDCRFRCNGLSYRRSVEFMAELQRRLKAGDRDGIVDLVGFPLHVNGTDPMKLENRADLVREFEQVFTPGVIAKALEADPRLVFCNYKGIMLGDGVIWAYGSDEQPYRLDGINQPADR